MADVSLESSDRGQLFITAALAIAVILIILALLLNGVIYAENVATRSTGDETTAATGTVQEAGFAVGAILDAENHEKYDDEADLKHATAAGINSGSDLFANGSARRGAAVSITWDQTEYEEGILIIQNESRAFTGQSGEANYSLATNASNTREYVLVVDTDSLNSTTDPVNESFYVTLDDGTDEHRIYVYADGNNDGNLTVAVGDETGGEPTPVCQPSSAHGNVTVDLTGGTVGGEPCSDSPWNLNQPYEITHTNGDRINGTYELTVQTKQSELDSLVQLLLNGGGDEQPYYVDALYSVTVEVTYRSSTVEYQTRIRVAPGEPDE